MCNFYEANKITFIVDSWVFVYCGMKNAEKWKKKNRKYSSSSSCSHLLVQNRFNFFFFLIKSILLVVTTTINKILWIVSICNTMNHWRNGESSAYFHCRNSFFFFLHFDSARNYFQLLYVCKISTSMTCIKKGKRKELFRETIMVNGMELGNE